MTTVRKVVTITPTITGGAYSVDDAIGGRMEFTGAKYLGGVLIESVTIIDKASVHGEIDIVFFSKTFTATADNDVFAPSDADLANAVGGIKIRSTDYIAFSTNSLACVASNMVYLNAPASGSDMSLWAQMVVRGAVTYASTSDLIIKLGLRMDS